MVHARTSMVISIQVESGTSRITALREEGVDRGIQAGGFLGRSDDDTARTDAVRYAARPVAAALGQSTIVR